MRRIHDAVWWLIVIAILGMAICSIDHTPHFYLTIGEQTTDLGPVKKSEKITLHYRHSVQQTHVWEYLQISPTQDSFVLTGTRYRSYGVGLPFLPSEGNYHREGNDFIIDNMHRYYPHVDLRIGIGTELSFIYQDQLFPLYQEYPPGTFVRLEVLSPLYYWWQKLTLRR